MAVVSVPGGGRTLEYYGNTLAETKTFGGTKAYWDWLPAFDQHVQWPVAVVRQTGTGVISSWTITETRTEPLTAAWNPYSYSTWIWYSWDLNWLTEQYGPPLAGTTTVTITIDGAIPEGDQFGGTGPFNSGQPNAHDLLACIPPAVASVTDWEWHNVLDVVLSPTSQGETYTSSPALTEWEVLNSSVSGGVPRFPARPFPSTIGPGGWTQVGSYHSDGNIWEDPNSVGGTWTVTVDLAQHARDGHLVIVCAAAGMFTQDDSLLQEVVRTGGNPSSTNENWVARPLASLLWNSVPPKPDDLGFEGRAHFFRGGPGEIPIGTVAG